MFRPYPAYAAQHRQLLSLSNALFVRSSVGTYRTSASTIVSVAADILREEYGYLLIEKLATNVNPNGRDLAAASYTAAAGATNTDVLAGPDGLVLADQSVVASGAFSRYRANEGAGRAVCTLWRRRMPAAGAGAHQMLAGTAGSLAGYVGVATETWERVRLVQPNAAAAQNSFIPVEGRAVVVNSGTNTTAQALNIVTDLLHAELGVRYATSTIINNVAGVVARQADVLTWVAAEVPLALREQRTEWNISPCFASSDLASGDVRVLGSWGSSNDVLRLRHDGVGVLVEAVTLGVVRAVSGYITFAADPSVYVIADPAVATIRVDGAATGDGTGAVGTAWSWAGGVGFRLGGAFGGSDEIDGGIVVPATT